MGNVSLINGHIDPDYSPEQMLTMLNDELEELVDGFYDGIHLRPFKVEDEYEIQLEDAIEELFYKYKDVVSIFSIEKDTCFESPAYDVGIISIAYVNSITGLEHLILRWEVE